MLFATEVIQYTTVKWYSHSQVNELLLTLALTLVAAAITAWWTRSTSTPKWKSLPKAELATAEADPLSEVPTPSSTDSKVSSFQDGDDWRSVASNAETETTEADLSNHPDAEITDADPSSSPDGQDDDNDDSDGDSRVDVDSWGAVAGRFASALSLEYDADDDEFWPEAAKSIPMDLSESPDGQQDDDDSSDGDSRVDVDSWGAVAGRFAAALSLEDDDEDDWGAVAGRFASVLSLVDDDEDDEALSAAAASILRRTYNSSTEYPKQPDTEESVSVDSQDP